MVDVSGKPISRRVAVATGSITLAPDTIALILENGLKKGDVLAVARVAGIQAAKRTWDTIPLCHQIPLSKVSIEFDLRADSIFIRAEAKTTSQTGVEMEALHAVSVAALTIYDMCKAVDTSMVITDVTLELKSKAPIEQSNS